MRPTYSCHVKTLHIKPLNDGMDVSVVLCSEHAFLESCFTPEPSCAIYEIKIPSIRPLLSASLDWVFNCSNRSFKSGKVVPLINKAHPYPLTNSARTRTHTHTLTD